MHFSVNIQPGALADAEEFVAFIRSQKLEPRAAGRWYDGLTEAIESLALMPQRCPLIPEQEDFKIELRHHHFHSHRIIFHIDEVARMIHVLRVYHGARDALRPERIETP